MRLEKAAITIFGKRIFYGWIIVATGFLVLCVEGSCIFYSFGIFLKPMIAELEAGRAAGSAAFTVFQLVVGMSSPLVAIIIGKLGCRFPMAIGFTLAAVGMALLSRITEIWQLWLLYGVIVGIGVAFGHLLALTTLVNLWFVKRKALAIGIVVAGMGTGPLIFSRPIASLVMTLGWRNSWLVLAAVVFLLAAIPALLFMRDRREEDDHLKEDSFDKGGEKDLPKASKALWTVRQGIRTRALWFIIIFACANQFTLNMMNSHQIAHLTDIGIPAVTAAGSLGLMVGMSGIGRLTGGVLGDRFRPRFLVAVAVLVEIIALMIFVSARSMISVYSYAVLLGFSYGMVLVLHMVMVSKYYGARSYAKMAAVVMLVTTPIYALGPLVAGYVYDLLGSYLVPFYACIIFLVIGCLCALLARPPVWKEKN